MLMIAQPKSWSSAVMTYIKTTHNVGVRQCCVRNDFNLKVPKGYENLATLHCCVANVTHGVVKKLVQHSRFHRQHFPPTTENIAVLKEWKDDVLILLRNPVESLFSYWRSVRKGIHVKHKVMYDEKLFYELQSFYNGWKSSGMSFVTSPLTSGKVNTIEEFYGFEKTENPILPKSKYTRD